MDEGFSVVFVADKNPARNAKAVRIFEQIQLAQTARVNFERLAAKLK